jgi:8-oxo-dGTP pyrophosphatase MutT (NUDIX family)
MIRQFTSTVYVLDAGKVLMIFHRKLQKWLPPGGHVDPNELPTEAGIREVLEETGVEIKIISDEHVWIDRWNARSLPRPYLCLLENLPAHGDQPAHQHIDLIYLGQPIGGSINKSDKGIEEIRWFSLEEIDALEPDVDIFVETQQTLRKLLAESFALPGALHA